jgi:hypothetical protein
MKGEKGGRALRDKGCYPVEGARRVKAGLEAPRVSAPPLTAQRPGKR